MYSLVALTGALLPSLVHTFDNTIPQTVKFNLLFPRNETYAVDKYVPVVFSISNTSFASSMLPVFKIGISSYDNGSPSPAGNTSDDGNFPDLRDYHLSYSDPYYVSSYIASIGGQEGTWLFRWSVETNYGLRPLSNATNATIEHGSIKDRGSFVFTTKKGAPPPDLIAGTANTSCASVPYTHEINITDILDVPCVDQDRAQYPFLSHCPVIANDTTSVTADFPIQPVPAGTGCGLQIDASSASTIIGAINVSLCLNPLLGFCVAQPAQSTNSALHMLPTGVVALVLGVTLGSMLI